MKLKGNLLLPFLLLFIIGISCRKEQIRETHVYGTFYDEFTGKPIEGLDYLIIELYDYNFIGGNETRMQDTLFRGTTGADGKYDFTFHGITKRYAKSNGDGTRTIVLIANKKVTKCFLPNTGRMDPPSTSDRYLFYTTVEYKERKSNNFRLKPNVCFYLKKTFEPSLDVDYTSFQYYIDGKQTFNLGGYDSGKDRISTFCNLMPLVKHSFVIKGANNGTPIADVYSRDLTFKVDSDICESIVLKY